MFGLPSKEEAEAKRQEKFSNAVNQQAMDSQDTNDTEDAFRNNSLGSEEKYKQEKNKPEYKTEIDNAILSKEYHLGFLEPGENGFMNAGFVAKSYFLATRFMERHKNCDYSDISDRILTFNAGILSISRSIGGKQQILDSERKINKTMQFVDQRK